MAKPEDRVSEFFTRYPSSVSELATALRALIRSTIPDASETLDESGRVVGYAVGSGYAGLVCTIIPSKSGVKLGVVRGAELDDPHSLLVGGGKKHRYVEINERAALRRAGLKGLIRNARVAANRDSA